MYLISHTSHTRRHARRQTPCINSHSLRCASVFAFLFALKHVEMSGQWRADAQTNTTMRCVSDKITPGRRNPTVEMDTRKRCQHADGGGGYGRHGGDNGDGGDDGYGDAPGASSQVGQMWTTVGRSDSTHMRSLTHAVPCAHKQTRTMVLLDATRPASMVCVVACAQTFVLRDLATTATVCVDRGAAGARALSADCSCWRGTFWFR